MGADDFGMLISGHCAPTHHWGSRAFNCGAAGGWGGGGHGGFYPPRPKALLEGEGGSGGTYTAAAKRLQGTAHAVQGRLLAVRNAVEAGVGECGCLWGSLRAGVWGGAPPPPSSDSLPRPLCESNALLRATVAVVSAPFWNRVLLSTRGGGGQRPLEVRDALVQRRRLLTPLRHSMADGPGTRRGDGKPRRQGKRGGPAKKEQPDGMSHGGF